MTTEEPRCDIGWPSRRPLLLQRGLQRLLPATAQRLVKLDHAQQFVQPDLAEIQLRLK
jgi:hypothetical protein